MSRRFDVVASLCAWNLPINRRLIVTEFTLEWHHDPVGWHVSESFASCLTRNDSFPASFFPPAPRSSISTIDSCDPFESLSHIGDSSSLSCGGLGTLNPLKIRIRLLRDGENRNRTVIVYRIKVGVGLNAFVICAQRLEDLPVPAISR